MDLDYWDCFGRKTIYLIIEEILYEQLFQMMSQNQTFFSCARIAQATAALTKLKPIWRDNLSLGSKVKLMCSLIAISTFLYACELWTLKAELEKRIQAFEMRWYQRLLNISYKDHITNEVGPRKIQPAIGEYDELLTMVKK